MLEDLISRARGLPRYRSAAQNHVDTFEGGVYHRSFEKAVRKLNALSAIRGCGDARILDQVWGLVKGCKGVGGGQNNEEVNVKGFVAKKVEYSYNIRVCEIFCTHGELTFGTCQASPRRAPQAAAVQARLGRCASKRFVSGPNPCKLVAMGLQKRHCTRREHV